MWRFRLQWSVRCAWTWWGTTCGSRRAGTRCACGASGSCSAWRVRAPGRRRTDRVSRGAAPQGAHRRPWATTAACPGALCSRAPCAARSASPHTAHAPPRPRTRSSLASPPPCTTSPASSTPPQLSQSVLSTQQWASLMTTGYLLMRLLHLHRHPQLPQQLQQHQLLVLHHILQEWYDQNRHEQRDGAGRHSRTASQRPCSGAARRCSGARRTSHARSRQRLRSPGPSRRAQERCVPTARHDCAQLRRRRVHARSVRGRRALPSALHSTPSTASHSLRPTSLRPSPPSCAPSAPSSTSRAPSMVRCPHPFLTTEEHQQQLLLLTQQHPQKHPQKHHHKNTEKTHTKGNKIHE